MTKMLHDAHLYHHFRLATDRQQLQDHRLEQVAGNAPVVMSHLYQQICKAWGNDARRLTNVKTYNLRFKQGNVAHHIMPNN